MTKALLVAVAVLFLSSCNHTAEPKPDADRVIKDTLAMQILLQPFNQNPPQQNIYVKADIRQDKQLCARDAAIKRVMASLKTTPQNFVIDNNLPSHITGVQGTTLSFAPNSFVGNEGNEISGPVTIELKECYNPEAILCENLFTSADGGTSVSKGMVCVNAYSGGKILQLKQGETIHVQFPFTADYNNTYKIYHGEENTDGLIVWNAVCEEKTPGPKMCRSTDFIKPDFSYLGMDLKAYLLQNIEYPDEARRNELSANVDVTFKVNKEGKVTDVITAESYKIFRDVIEASIKNMPAWKPAAFSGKNIASSVHVNIDFNIRRANQVQVTFNETKASLISEANSVYVLYGTDLKGETQGLTAQALSRTGWFNYSRLVKTKSQKAELLVASNSKTEIKLLMKKSKAIISGENCVWFTDFKNLPIGEEAYIVAVRSEGNNMLYAVQPVTLTKQTVISLKWKKGDKEEIARVYHKLGKSIS